MAEWFALVTFEEHGAPAAGTLIRDKIIPLDAGYSHFQRQARAPALMDRGASSTVLNLLRHYPDSFDRLGAMADFFARAGGDLQQLALDPASVRLLAPVLNPAKMLFAGANYTDHVEEMKAPPVDKTKAKPYFFPKTNNCLVGPYEPITFSTVLSLNRL
ncbi:MAG: hypothetical protein HYS14_08560 [Candidatus Rokubacteria bacterium]|nr:hypothetical protein [Candidatus Rokubacteria bacterium]